MILTTRCFLLLALLMPTVSFGAGMHRVQAVPRITAVTVYTDRAMTTRTVNLSLKPGTNMVSFANLPALLQDDSVRVEGKGVAGVTIVGLEVKRVFLDQSGDQRVKEIDDQIRNLERQAGGLEAKKNGLASQKAFLDSIRVAWGDRISKEIAIGRPTTADLQAAAVFIGSGVTGIEEQHRDLDAEKKLLREKIDALRRQRDESVGTRKKETKTVEVSLEAAREGLFTLELAAITPQAGWEPSYDVRLAADGKTAALVFRGLVRQQTGEDWQDVALTLSTARPAAGGAPPELNPWVLSFYRPQPPAAPMMVAAPAPQRARKAVRNETVSEALDEAVSAPPANLAAQATGEQTSVSFHVQRLVDIPSDGTRQSNVVATEQLPVSLEFLAVPKLSPFVFLTSELVNPTNYPFLSGPVHIFVGNTFTGSTLLKSVAPGEKFDLFFGADEQMTVKREELKQHKAAGVFSKNSMSYRYRIEVGNFRGTAQTLTLRDQLPIAADSEIKVSLAESGIKPDEIRDDGRLTWKIPLQAGEKKELTFGILVEYPDGRDIAGM